MTIQISDTNKIRLGYYSAQYFNRARETTRRMDCPATMQVFNKAGGILAGMDFVVDLLHDCAGYWKDEERARWHAGQVHSHGHIYTHDVLECEDWCNDNWVSTFDQLEITHLKDGEIITPWEPVLQIKGQYSYIAHLESVYLGMLARATKIATNTHNCVGAAAGKELLYFNDRFDHYGAQEIDGEAARIGGASGVATPAQGFYFLKPAVGTMPHALIAVHNGDIVAACRSFHKNFPDIPLVALVDFRNDCITDITRLLESDLANLLYGVRLDTSENMVDVSIANLITMGEWDGRDRPNGVCMELVQATRELLDDYTFDDTKIIVSGGFTPDRITAFELADVPVDVYAVGSSMLEGSYDFTADICEPSVKTGRSMRKMRNAD